MSTISSTSASEQNPFPELTKHEKTQLQEMHKKFRQYSKRTGYYVMGASFLIISAFIVIMCGCLCLMLPGVNVITHVILPAVLPGTISIIISVPLVLLAFKSNMSKNTERKKMITQMFEYFELYDIPRKAKKERVLFILHNFFQWEKDPESSKLTKNRQWSKEYQGKLISDLKKHMGDQKDYEKPQNNDQRARKKIATSLDKALQRVHKKD